jgi:hypothetical protein
VIVCTPGKYPLQLFAQVAAVRQTRQHTVTGPLKNSGLGGPRRSCAASRLR